MPPPPPPPARIVTPHNFDDQKAWDDYFNARLSSPLYWDSIDVLFEKHLALARAKGGRIWYPGCGLDRSALAYANQGCKVVATDFSSIAVKYQKDLSAKFLKANGSPSETGTFSAAEQDFTRCRPDGAFDMVLNRCAFQRLSRDNMKAAAAQFYAALRPGGVLVLETLNLSEGRDILEDKLIEAGFYIPYLKSERWYRDEAARIHRDEPMLIGEKSPRSAQDQWTARREELLRPLHSAYIRKRAEEAEEANALLSNPSTITAEIEHGSG